MTRYITQKEKILTWIKKVVESLDEQPRNLSQLLATANLQGFKKKAVLDILESYKELGEIFFSTEKNVIYSLRVVPREIKEEIDGVLSGNPII